MCASPRRSGTVHFFAVVDRTPDSLLSENTPHELRYFRAQQMEEGLIAHDSQPVMGVTDLATSPWPLPALQLYWKKGISTRRRSCARHGS
jgi:hypothetical protein